MKMKCHKIRGVEKSVCTAEQKIAYNLAFRAHISFGDEYKKLHTSVAKSEALSKIRDMQLKNFKSSYDYKPGKFNEDAIFCALNAGLKNYIEMPFIATDYGKIGEAFPIVYGIE